MSVVGEPLVLMLILDIKTKASPTTDIGDADFSPMSVVGEPLVLLSKISVTYVCGRRTLSFNADFRY
jgi:hypothetical protein